jgi:AraC-like DNA-binding protein
VEFECPDNAIVYDAAILTSPVRNADPRLHGILSEFLLQQIADLSDRTDPVAEARWLIRRLMPQARANLKFAAGEMGYSPRTLQRRLHDGNTSFADLLQEVRLEKWREEGRRAPGRKMAATLGFCEESSYHKWKRRQNLK